MAAMRISMCVKTRNSEYVGEWGDTLKGEVEETESSRGSGVTYEPITAGWELFRSVMDDIPCTSRTASLWITSYRSLPIVGSSRHCRLARSVECRWQTGRVDSDGAKLQDPERGVCIQPVREQYLRGQLRDSCSSSECQ